MNYVVNEQLDFDLANFNFSQHDPYPIPSEILLWYSYSASFKNQTETLIDLLHQLTHHNNISSTTIKSLVNITKMQHHPR